MGGKSAHERMGLVFEIGGERQDREKEKEGRKA